jgi:hypothetical protein
MKTTCPMPRLAFFVPPILENFLSPRHTDPGVLVPLVERALRHVGALTPPPPLLGCTGDDMVIIPETLTLPDGTSVAVHVFVTRRGPWFAYLIPDLPEPVDSEPTGPEPLAFTVRECSDGVVVITMHCAQTHQAEQRKLYGGERQLALHRQGAYGEQVFSKWLLREPSGQA